MTKATRLVDATEDWQLCGPPEEERHGHIREPDGDTGRTRFYVREGQEPRIGFPAIEWREEATREWLEGLASGKSAKRH